MDNRIAIVTSGYFPVPATKGGAVEALVENVINENERQGKLYLTVFSSYEENAIEIAKEYKNTEIIFVKTPWLIKVSDVLIFHLAKDLLKKQKSLSYRYICQRLWFINKVSMYIKKNNYDKVVLENHSSLFMTLKKRGNAEKYKDKYYYHLHNVVTNDYGCKEIIQKTKKVLGVSNYINKTLQSYLGITNIEYSVLRNMIDSRKFKITNTTDEKKAIRQQYGIRNSERIVLFTGRFSPEKGIRELLLAFKQLEQSNTILLVVGGYYFGSGMDSPFEKEMKMLVDSMEDKIKFTGYVDYNNIPQLYSIADIVVIPSVWDDPAPLTVIESLSSGKPLITTYSGGIPEYADEDSAIILRRDNLVEQLTSAMNELLNNPDKCKQLSENALKLTKSWSVCEYYEEFVKEILS